MESFHTTVIEDISFTVLSRYQNLVPLGRGAQGFVVEATDELKNEQVAIKKMSHPFDNEIQAKRAYREFTLMKRIRHKNVVPLLNHFTPQTDRHTFRDIYLVMEKMDGNLTNAIERRQQLTHEHISYLLYQIFCGLRHLHMAKVIHRDLKPQNIGVNGDCSLKILDFGLAKVDDERNSRNTYYVVTRYYRAPEIILGMRYSTKVDIWSVGCILAELITGSVLFPGEETVQNAFPPDQLKKIIEGLGTPSDDFIDLLRPLMKELMLRQPRFPGRTFEEMFPNEVFPPDSTHHEVLTASNARDLLSKMLIIDPRQRLSVRTALRHPYVNLWYDEADIERPAYSLNMDKEEHSLEEWKDMIFQVVKDYETESL